MLRALAVIGSVFSCLAFFTVANILADEATNDADLKQMQGTWTIVRCEFAGEEMKVAAGLRHSIDENKINRPQLRTRVYGFELDPTKSPKQIDLSADRLGDHVLKGIYKIEKDSFSICYAYDPDLPRPNEFKTEKGVPGYLYVYKRSENQKPPMPIVQNPPPSGRWARVSPFTSVDCQENNRVEVTFDKVKYELISIDGLKTKAILDAARKHFGRQWEKRFVEDLVEVMAAMDKKPGKTVKLVLRDLKTDKTVTVENAPMTAENRAAVLRSRSGDTRSAPPTPLTADQYPQVLEEFRIALTDRWAYLKANDLDLDAVIRELQTKSKQKMSPNDFAIELNKVIARGIDGHAGVSGYRLPGGYLPFLIETSGERFVALKPDRSGFVNSDHPYIEQIDGRDLSEWCTAASVMIPDGSPQYVRRHCLRQLRHVQYWRGVMDIEPSDTLSVTLVSEDGKDQIHAELPVAERYPVYGVWPRSSSRLLPGNIGYLRLTSMNRAAVQEIERWMPQFRDSRGLIVDVRDNGGGTRDALRMLFSYLHGPDDPPRVMNAAKYRLHPDFGENHLDARFMYRLESPRWTGAEREAITEFAESFRPEWNPPADKFSQWHYMVLKRLEHPDVFHYSQPVVVLMNSKCFSATDIFLAGLKGCRNVTLLGTRSGGGSARSQSVRLGTSLTVRIASMASFQANGKLFDGNGVPPDVVVEPAAEYYIGGRDHQLEKAIEIIGGDAE